MGQKRSEYTQPFVLRVSNPQARLRLLADERRHGGEPIDRTYELPEFKGRTDQHQIREGMRTETEHLQDFAARWPDEQVIAFVGNGNLLMNVGFVAFRRN